ncbi:LamG domain-containing protein [Bellilinea sp.]
MTVGFAPDLAVRADGLAGFALSFDGTDDMVNLGRTVDLFPDEGWKETKTVSLWVKPEGTADCSVINGILRIEPAQCDNIFGDFARWWGISRGPTQIWVWMACYDPADPSTYPPSSPIRLIQFGYNLNEWMHIALVHGNGFLSAYKNGSLIGSVNCIATAQPPAQPVLFFGGMIKADSQNQNHSFWGFQGQIDELRIYSTALSQQEIQNTMMTELNGNEAGLVAYYKMSNDSGLMVSDDSGNGKDGQLMDGTTIVAGNGTPPLWVVSGAFDNIPPTVVPSPTSTWTFTPSPSPLPPTITPTRTATFTPGVNPTFTSSPSPVPPTITTTRTATPTFTWTPEIPTATIANTRTPRPTFTPSPSPFPPTVTNTWTPRPTRVAPTQSDITPTRTIDPNMDNFIFLPLVRK